MFNDNEDDSDKPEAILEKSVKSENPHAFCFYIQPE